MNPYQMLFCGSNVIAYAEQLLNHTPMAYLQIIFLGLWIILFVYIKRLFKARNRKLIALLSSLLCLAGLLVAFKYALQKRVYLKTISATSALYSGPAKTFTQLHRIPAGEELIKLQVVGDFYKARWHGTIAWINKKDIVEYSSKES